MIQELQGYNIEEKYQNSNEFLAEEILLPHLNKCDTTRVNLFTSYITQAQILIDGDFPKVSSGFENQVGKYSSLGYTKSDRNFKVVGKIYRNKLNYTLILYDEENDYLDVLEVTPAENVTESFGYTQNTEYTDSLEVDSVIPKDKVMIHNNSYDEHLNLRYGANIATAFMAYKELTHEDK